MVDFPVNNTKELLGRDFTVYNPIPSIMGRE